MRMADEPRASTEGYMNRDALPQFILAKLLALDEAVAALKAGAAEIEHGIEDRRSRLWGNVRHADDDPRTLEAELENFLADQKVLQKRQAEQAVLSACKAWVDRLPAGTKLEPGVEVCPFLVIEVFRRLTSLLDQPTPASLGVQAKTIILGYPVRRYTPRQETASEEIYTSDRKCCSPISQPHLSRMRSPGSGPREWVHLGDA
jgi:hypothetical protein